jgi:2-aminoethylphosphonate-pyruvate transaminase
MSAPFPPTRDKLLFTPGPLTTSLAVKQAMLHDAGSWHSDFNALVASVRDQLLNLADLSRERGWEAVLLQGSGTYGLEAVFQTCVPRTGKVAVLANGAYGNRMVQILKQAGIDHAVLRTSENKPVDPEALEDLLLKDAQITHVATVHCETTTGILNPIAQVGRVVGAHHKAFFVDAMSSFGGMPIHLAECNIDFLISSPNKCLEGVPGFCFVLCRRDALLASEGQARSLSLDLLAQLKGFEATGQFRFTPPTHALLAFNQALAELAQEGGIIARAERYRQNHQLLLEGLAELGLRPYLEPAVQSCFITAFEYPAASWFSFDLFYRKLSERGFIIYPGKLTQENTFRIGTIGRLFPSDLQQLVYAMGAVLREMKSHSERSMLPKPPLESAKI